MLRDKNLVSLSRQHQHALALCVRIGRGSPIPVADLPAWQNEIAQHFRAEIRIHFAAEERLVFPSARKFPVLNSLVDDLVNDHAWLRNRFEAAASYGLSGEDIVEFARRLSRHIRKEERELFETIQQLMTAQELAAIGAQLDDALKDAEQACALRAKEQ